MENETNNKIISGLIPFNYKKLGLKELRRIENELIELGIYWFSLDVRQFFLKIDSDSSNMRNIVIKNVDGKDKLFYSTKLNPTLEGNEEYFKINPNKIKEGYEQLKAMRIAENL